MVRRPAPARGCSHFPYTSPTGRTPGRTILWPQMRTAALSLALALGAALLVSSSQARRGAPGDGCLVVRDGKGLVSLNARGFVFGRFDEGFITIDESAPGRAKVFGWQKRSFLSDTRTQYSGYPDVRFRAGGAFRITVSARFMDISAAGRGVVTLAAPDFLDAGTFSVDADSFCQSGFQPLPDLPRRFALGSQGGG